MIAKQEEDAIVIEDDIEPEGPLEELQPAEGNTYFDIQLAIQKETHLEEDSEEKLIRRLIKFFEYNRTIQPGKEYFCPRKDTNLSEGVELLETQLIIHGYDFMKLKDVKKSFDTSQAVRINPSNFKLIYPDRGSAWQAFVKNAREPAALYGKRESEDSPPPSGWFDMKPYTFNNRVVQASARFATEKEKDLHPRQEERYQIYCQCAQIYNSQEERRREEEASKEALKRERLEIRKQKNSDGLYESYRRNAEQGWMRGKNSNPGANRDNDRGQSRSRSRSRGKQQRERDENSSNYSFVLGDVNKQMEGIHLRDSSVREPEKVDVSLEMRPESDLSYNWQGSEAKVKKDWSYSEYMRDQEAEEELRERERKIEVITIEDDN